METLFAQLPGWLERTPSFATAIAIALAYALSTRARKSDPLYTSSVVNLLSAAACITISAVVAGVFSGWEWRGMQHAGVGALAAVAFAVGDSADMSLVVTTVSIVLLFADYTTGAPMERLRAAARFAQPLVVGTSAFLLSECARVLCLSVLPAPRTHSVPLCAALTPRTSLVVRLVQATPRSARRAPPSFATSSWAPSLRRSSRRPSRHSKAPSPWRRLPCSSRPYCSSRLA